MQKRTLKSTKNMYMPLGQNPAYNLAANHAIELFQSNSIYTFIPKNGCSTLRLSIALHNGAIDNINDINWIHNNNQTFKPSLKSILTADYTFVILRCPLKRLASVFLDKIVSKEIDAWQLRNATNREIDLDTFTFAEFVKLLQTPQYLQSNIHWKKQTDFLLYKQYDDYFQFEKFDYIKETLANRINLELIDSREKLKHDTSHYNFIANNNFSNTPAREIAHLKSQGQCPSHEALYTDELTSITKNIYKSDLDLYTSLFN